MWEVSLHTDDVRPRISDLSGTDTAPVHGTRPLWPSAGRRSTASKVGSLVTARPKPLGSTELASEAGSTRRRRPARAEAKVTRPCALACAEPSFRTVRPMANALAPREGEPLKPTEEVLQDLTEPSNISVHSDEALVGKVKSAIAAG